MKAIRVPAFLLALLLSTWCAAEDGPDEFVMVPAEFVGKTPPVDDFLDTAVLEDYIRGVIASIERDKALPALTMSVVHNDQPVLQKGYGLADIDSGRPVVPDETLFRIGSVSKTFTWTAVMMLFERGLLDLDTDVNQYLVDIEVDEAFDAPVTLRDLMHHRAGFEDSMQLFAVSDDDPRSLAELLETHHPKRVFAPGTRTIYSNWGSALAAQIVEDVSGMPYGEFLRAEILDPLGMHDTHWQPPEKMDAATRDRLAIAYRHRQGAFDLQHYMQIGAYWPAGGMVSTATDMARWMRLHLNAGELDGTRLLDSDTHQRMWTRGFDDRPQAADLAHGFQDRPYRSVRALGHGGGTAGYLTQMVLVPELGLGIFYSYNSAHTPAPFMHLADLIIDRVIDHHWRPVKASADEEEAGELAELAGTYLNNRRVFSSFAAVFGLMNSMQVTPLTADTIRIDAAGESSVLRRVTDDVFESARGQRVAFVRDERGRVAALADDMGVHTAERVGWLGNPNTFFLALGLAGILTLTSALGAWRNFGRGVNSGFAARIAGAGVLVGVVTVTVFIGSVVALIITLGDFDIGRMPDFYPSPAMFVTHYAGWAVAGAALLMMLAQWPAWSGSNWGLLRRLHFGLFMLATAFLAFMLWQWRIIGGPVI
ncbi:beta-lactamase family protein [Wenzhouxiangella sp. AB-CW3]|uniref:serine hydrolase domain-containing protein n=1 Tax=Wenzhouxiangella sp. AB-CW3 TaxID=2771012 RepID=UPI00168A8C4A|nr:serine hydrolase domain-containing protein [Wenzhouxiangella sp. AB-CW3]QOC23221.1 beta-lactamase family protein [Wenzhouxiangella sp. AB-CW3]